MARPSDEVHVFISTGRFRSLAEMRAYTDESYTDDGKGIPSAFMSEVNLTDCEPGCIEAYPSATGLPVPLAQLLAGASYAEQWLPRLDESRQADAALCVFTPNRVGNPGGCSMEYVGVFEYRVVHPEWLQRILRGEAPAPPQESADSYPV